MQVTITSQSELCLVFTEKYCTEHKIEKLPGPRDWVQILQDQIKLARRRLKRGTDTKSAKVFSSLICFYSLTEQAVLSTKYFDMQRV